ncbi:MAG: hypothetical protein QM764_11480 [Chitinophagaceae bacterium]
MNKEEWEQFYYESGEERNLKVQSLALQEQALLNDHTLKRTNPQKIDQLDWDTKNLNFQYGRTKQQFLEKGVILHDYVRQKGVDITEEECAECVRYRTICETWNGIIIRELNTIEKLKAIFPLLEFTKTSGEFDHRYAVDYELKSNDQLLCGVQIKPRTYTFNTPYIVKARNANVRKNQEYFDTFQKQVFDIISKTSGDIENVDVIDKIRSLNR